jgi:3-oxoacyl-[acyl-carrier protein] reductase
MKLVNRVALVTGSGSGIGREIAVLLAEEGAIVVINDINVEAARKTVQAVESAKGRACAIQADVADSAQVKAMFAETDARFGALHILVNMPGLPLRQTDGKRSTGRRKRAWMNCHAKAPFRPIGM